LGGVSCNTKGYYQLAKAWLSLGSASPGEIKRPHADVLPIAKAEQSAVAHLSATEQAMFDMHASKPPMLCHVCAQAGILLNHETDSCIFRLSLAMHGVSISALQCCTLIASTCFVADVSHRHCRETGTTPVIVIQPGKVTASTAHAAES